MTHTHLLRSPLTKRVVWRVTVPDTVPHDQVRFYAQNLALQQGVRGVQWLEVERIKRAANRENVTP